MKFWVGKKVDYIGPIQEKTATKASQKKSEANTQKKDFCLLLDYSLIMITIIIIMIIFIILLPLNNSNRNQC